jgi:hypothetical protein
MASGSKKGTQIYFSILSKSPGKRNPPRFPKRAPMEREAHLQGILHISQKPHLSGSLVKEPSLKVPLMESLAERCPTTTAFLHSSIKVPGIEAPPPHIPSSSRIPTYISFLTFCFNGELSYDFGLQMSQFRKLICNLFIYVHEMYRVSHSLPNPAGWWTAAPCRNN